MKPIKDLVKFNMIIFVLICGVAGYGLGYQIEQTIEMVHLLKLFFGLALITAGSFALNQAQDSDIDALMPRTQNRPIPAGKISLMTAWMLGLLMVGAGAFMLYLAKPICAWLGLGTVFLYNVLYTLHWKRKLAFGAVPGAIPGAMPVLIGYAATHPQVITIEAIYVFMIMFLWQMPHFWSLAIRYKDDYAKAGIPVLPLVKGDDATMFHIGVYTFIYIALAVASPWFVHTRWAYVFLVLPFAVTVLWQFYKYQKMGNARWLRFFLWVNFSMLAFLVAPVIDRWLTYFTKV